MAFSAFPTILPVRIDVGDAGEQPEGATELRVDAVVQKHELAVGRREAQLTHRLELIQLSTLVEVAVLRSTHPTQNNQQMSSTEQQYKEGFAHNMTIQASALSSLISLS